MEILIIYAEVVALLGLLFGLDAFLLRNSGGGNGGF